MGLNISLFSITILWAYSLVMHINKSMSNKYGSIVNRLTERAQNTMAANKEDIWIHRSQRASREGGGEGQMVGGGVDDS